MFSTDTAVAVLRSEQARLNDLFDRAIAVFDEAPATNGHRRRSTPSVRTRMIDLIESEDRTWTADGVLAALDAVGKPVQSVNPRRLVATGLAGLVREGLVVSVAPGVVRARTFAGREEVNRQ